MVRWRSLLVGGVISAVCIALLLRSVDLEMTPDSFARAEVRWLLVALACIGGSLFMRCWKWQLLFLPDDRISLGGSFNAALIGYMFNTVLPGRVGELVRATLISRTEGVGVTRALGTIFIEKILDILVLLALLGMLVLVSPLPAWITAAGVTASVAFISLAVVFFGLSGARAQTVVFVQRRIDPLPAARRVRPSRFVDALLGSARSLSRPNLILLQLLTSAGLWAFSWLTAAAALRAFHVDVPWTAVTLLIVTTNLGMTVPSAPGYIGVYEAVAVSTLAIFGVDPGPALGVALALHVLGFGSFTVIGAILLFMGLAQGRFTVSGLLSRSTAAAGTSTPTANTMGTTPQGAAS